MSNNKQSMKLYTENQVRLAMDFARGHNKMTDSQFIDLLIPIELPSDEEIEDKGKWAFNDAGHTIFTHYNTVPSWVDGAKWMRDKIQGGNK
jgi:hypothetical protein